MPAVISVLLALFYGSTPQKFATFVSELDLFGRLYSLLFRRYLLLPNASMPTASRMNIDAAVLLANLIALLLQVVNLCSVLVSYRPIVARWHRQRFRSSAGAYFAPMRTTLTIMATVALLAIGDLFFGGLLIHYLEFQFTGVLTSFGAFLWHGMLLFCLLQFCVICAVMGFAFSAIDP
jgi:hypothetical protein